MCLLEQFEVGQQIRLQSVRQTAVKGDGDTQVVSPEEVVVVWRRGRGVRKGLEKDEQHVVTVCARDCLRGAGWESEESIQWWFP